MAKDTKEVILFILNKLESTRDHIGLCDVTESIEFIDARELLKEIGKNGKK